jgi:phage shock protein E
MRLWLLVFVAIAVLGLGTSCRSTGAGPAASDQARFIDVRTPAEFQADHVPGAVNVPVAELNQRIDTLVPDKQTAVYLHCASGRRSANAAASLRAMGYANVHDLGSFASARQYASTNSWVNAGARR